MALQRSTVEMNIATSLSQGADAKKLRSDKLAVSKNTQVTKDGALDKRPGFTTLSTDVSTSFPNPLSISTGLGKSFGFTHDDQVLLQNKGAIYARSNLQSKWVFKNHYLPVEVTSEIAVANENSTVVADSGTVNGITVIAYEANSGFTSGSKISYSVIEDATGAFIVNQAVISSSSTANCPRVICFSNSIVITYTEAPNLKSVLIDLTTGQIASTVTLKTDVNTTVNDLWMKQHDWTVTSASSTVGEAAIGIYVATSSYRLIMMDATGALIASPGTLTVATPTKLYGYGLSVFCDPAQNANRFFVTYFDYASRTLKAASWTFSSSAYAVNFAAVTIHTSSRLVFAEFYNFTPRSCAFATHPIDSSKIVLFYDNHPLAAGAYDDTGYPRNYEARIYSAVLTTSGTISTAASIYSSGTALAAKPISDADRQTIYLVALYESQFQGAYFLLDYMKSNASGGPLVQAKWESGSAGVRHTFTTVLPSVTAFANHVYGFVGNFKLDNDSKNSANALVNHCGLKRYKINLAPTFAGSALQFAGTTHVTGGFLAAFDGTNFHEHGFLVDPEIPIACGTDGIEHFDSYAGNSTNVAWRAYSFNCSGIHLKNATLKHWQFNTPTTSYYVWYRVDGVNSDPAPGGVGILVDILSTDSPFEIAYKTVAAIEASGAAVNSSVGQHGSLMSTAAIYVYNNAVGTVVNPIGGLQPQTGLLSGGSYQYRVVFKAIDASGKIYRSAPSVTKTVSTVTRGTVSLLVAVPTLTNRSISKLTVEIYRTSSNGTVLRKATSLPTEAGSATLTAPFRIAYLDQLSDANLSSREAIYTNGGVLSNYSVGGCKLVTSYRGRLAVVPSDDPKKVLISKAVVTGEPVNFAEEIYVSVDADDGDIQAIAVMDEKMIILKRTPHVYLVAGDPPNDLGTGSTLTQPVLIPADSGCVDPNSVVVFPGGVIYKSAKGLRLIGRDLQISPIGQDVIDYNSYRISSALLVEDKSEVRFTHQDTDAMLVYNYEKNIWSVWTNMQSDSAFLAPNGTYTRVKNSGKVQQETPGVWQDVDGTSSNITREVELPWLSIKGSQDFQRILKLALLGDYKSAHTLNCVLSYDYDTNPANAKTYAWSTATGLTGSALGDQTYQPVFKPEIQKCQAVKVKFTEAGSGQSATWSDVSFDVALKAGLNKVKSEKRN